MLHKMVVSFLGTGFGCYFGVNQLCQAYHIYKPVLHSKEKLTNFKPNIWSGNKYYLKKKKSKTVDPKLP